MVLDTTRLTFGTIAIYFFVYLALHIIIGIMRNKAKKEIEFHTLRNEMDEISELQKRLNIWNKLFKFFPMAYVIIIICSLL